MLPTTLSITSRRIVVSSIQGFEEEIKINNWCSGLSWQGLGFAPPSRCWGSRSWNLALGLPGKQSGDRSGLFACLNCFVSLSAQRSAVVWQLSKLQANMWNYFESSGNTAVSLSRRSGLLVVGLNIEAVQYFCIILFIDWFVKSPL